MLKAGSLHRGYRILRSAAPGLSSFSAEFSRWGDGTLLRYGDRLFAHLGLGTAALTFDIRAGYNVLMKILPALLTLLLPAAAHARFYTYENLPSKPLNFDRAYAAALRLEVVNGGGDHCSATSVSSDGYILTNLHCVTDCLKENGFADKGLEEITGDNYTLLKTKIQAPKGLTCANLAWDDAAGNPHMNGRIVWLGGGANTFVDEFVNKLPADVFNDILAHQDDFAVMKFDLKEPVACVPVAAAAPQAGETAWNIGYPNFTMRYDGFDSTGYKKHISFGAVTGDIRTDAYLTTIITTEDQWKREEAAYDATRILRSITDSMHGNSGSMTINGSGELLAIHYSATSPSALRMEKDLGANALGLRADVIRQELRSALGEAAAGRIFSCPSAATLIKVSDRVRVLPDSPILNNINSLSPAALFDGAAR